MSETATMATNPGASMDGMNVTNRLLALMDDEKWQSLKTQGEESDDARWVRLKALYLAAPG
jgi:hypothetical protein